MNLSSRMEPFIRVNGRGQCVTVAEFKYGQTVHAMKESGSTIRLMAKESSGTSTEMYSTESGKMIRQTDTVFIHTSMAQSMKDIGKMIYSMVTALKHGQTGPSMKGTIKRARSMAEAPTFGAMDQSTLEIGLTTRLMGKGCTLG